MMINEEKYLMNDMLLEDNIIDQDYDYHHNYNSIGIFTKNIDNKRHYYVYEQNEIGITMWEKEMPTFEEALVFARRMWKGMKASFRRHKEENEAKKYLINDLLLEDNLIDQDYTFYHDCNSIGLYTKNNGNKRHYYVYETNEIGITKWEKEMSTFEEALDFARKMWEGMKAFFCRYKEEYESKKYLINDLLLEDNLIDQDYAYYHNYKSIGLYTKNIDNKRHYYVYETDERGNVINTFEKPTFEEALDFARNMFKSMIIMYLQKENDEKPKEKKLE